MIATIILLASLAMAPSQPIVFVSSFNGIEGDEAVLLSPPSPSTYEVQKVRAKRGGSQLYVLLAPDQIKLDAAYSLLTLDGKLISGIIKATPTVSFNTQSEIKVCDAVEAPITDGFLLTTGITYEKLRGPLAALIISKNEVFSARYDQIGTLFTSKTGDFDPKLPISVLIFTENGQKWLYTGVVEGKLLRFAKSKFPRGPL